MYNIFSSGNHIVCGNNNYYIGDEVELVNTLGVPVRGIISLVLRESFTIGYGSDMVVIDYKDLSSIRLLRLK